MIHASALAVPIVAQQMLLPVGCDGRPRHGIEELDIRHSRGGDHRLKWRPVTLNELRADRAGLGAIRGIGPDQGPLFEPYSDFHRPLAIPARSHKGPRRHR